MQVAVHGLREHLAVPDHQPLAVDRVDVLPVLALPHRRRHLGEVGREVRRPGGREGDGVEGVLAAGQRGRDLGVELRPGELDHVDRAAGLLLPLGRGRGQRRGDVGAGLRADGERHVRVVGAAGLRRAPRRRASDAARGQQELLHPIVSLCVSVVRGGHLIAPSSRPERIIRLRKPAITIIGRMAISTAAATAHHSSPRWLFWPATRIGRVCQREVVRKRANRNSFQMKAQRDQEGGDQAGQRHRQDDLGEDPPGRHVVDQGRLLDLDRQRLEEVAHQPDHDRQREGDVAERQAEEGVDHLEAHAADLGVHEDTARRR